MIEEVDAAASLATAETSVAATVSATSEAVDRTASAASEIRREKSLTDNFGAIILVVVRDDVLVVTGAKAEQQLSSADVARMQRRELDIDDFIIIVAVLNESSVSLSAALCSLSALLSKKQHRQSQHSKWRWEGCILVGNFIKWNHVRHYRTSLGHFSLDAVSMLFAVQRVILPFNAHGTC